LKDLFPEEKDSLLSTMNSRKVRNKEDVRLNTLANLVVEEQGLSVSNALVSLSYVMDSVILDSTIHFIS
jgi:hypothetical protein